MSVARPVSFSVKPNGLKAPKVYIINQFTSIDSTLGYTPNVYMSDCLLFLHRPSLFVLSILLQLVLHKPLMQARMQM